MYPEVKVGDILEFVCLGDESQATYTAWGIVLEDGRVSWVFCNRPGWQPFMGWQPFIMTCMATGIWKLNKWKWKVVGHVED